MNPVAAKQMIEKPDEFREEARKTIEQSQLEMLVEPDIEFDENTVLVLRESCGDESGGIIKSIQRKVLEKSVADSIEMVVDELRE